MSDRIRPHHTQNLPDLPKLESVIALDRGTINALAYWGWLLLFEVAVAIWGVHYAGDLIGDYVLIVAALVFVLTAVLFLRALCGLYYYKTDSNGLTFRGALRRGFLPWTSITRAALTETFAGNALLTLRANNTTIKITPRGFGGPFSADGLIASIWQHLKRAGLASDIELTDSMRSLWKEISVRDVEWGKLPPLSTKISVFAAIILLYIVVLTVWIPFGIGLPAMIVPVVMTLGAVIFIKHMIIPDMLYQARAIKINGEDMVVQLLLSNVRIAWADVTYAALVGSSLEIKASHLKHIVQIPYNVVDPQSKHLLLVVIAKLRTAGAGQVVSSPTFKDPIPEAPQEVTFRIWHPDGDKYKIAALQREYVSRLPDDIRRRIKKAYNISTITKVLFILLSCPLAIIDIPGFVSWLTRAGAGSGVVYFFPGNGLIAAIPYMLVLICISVAFGEYVGERLVGPYLPWWREFRNVEKGRSTKEGSIFTYVAIVIILLGVLAGSAISGSYVRVTDSGVGIRRMFAINEKFYPWSEVRAVQCHVKSRDTYEYSIRFSDGSDWTCDTGDMLAFWALDLEKAAKYIAAKSGKQAERSHYN